MDNIRIEWVKIMPYIGIQWLVSKNYEELIVNIEGYNSLQQFMYGSIECESIPEVDDCFDDINEEDLLTVYTDSMASYN